MCARSFCQYQVSLREISCNNRIVFVCRFKISKYLFENCAEQDAQLLRAQIRVVACAVDFGHLPVDLSVYFAHQLERLQHLIVGKRVFVLQFEVTLQQQVIFSDSQYWQLQIRGHFQAVAIFIAHFLLANLAVNNFDNFFIKIKKHQIYLNYFSNRLVFFKLFSRCVSSFKVMNGQN